MLYLVLLFICLYTVSQKIGARTYRREGDRGSREGSEGRGGREWRGGEKAGGRSMRN